MKRIMLFLVGVILLLPSIAYADEYIESMSFGTIDLNVSESKSVWNLTYYVGNITTAEIKVVPKDGVTIEGDGTVDIVEGSNTFTVEAISDKTSKTYTINVNVVSKSSSKANSDNSSSDNTNSNNPDTGSFLPISLSIFAIAGITGYSIIKKKKKFYRV